MRSIPLLAVDATTVFDDIAAAKQQPRRARMNAARPQVLAAYQNYEDAVPEVGALDEAPLTDLQKEALRHAFTVETQPMTTLRGDLLKRIIVARCPFCGISESSTLDHYLPKEQYPEFAVFPKNLVPSCAVCNTRKRDRIIDEGTDVRMFLHPCFDTIPDIEFLTVRTTWPARASRRWPRWRSRRRCRTCRRLVVRVHPRHPPGADVHQSRRAPDARSPRRSAVT